MYLRTRDEVKYPKVPIPQKYATRIADALGAVDATPGASIVKAGVLGTVGTISARTTCTGCTATGATTSAADDAPATAAAAAINSAIANTACATRAAISGSAFGTGSTFCYSDTTNARPFFFRNTARTAPDVNLCDPFRSSS